MQNVDYSDIMCQGYPIRQGSIVYHYVYGELRLKKITRVKTRFYQFNYLDFDVVNPASLSSVFLKEYGIETVKNVSFRHDYIDDWLFINKDDVTIPIAEYANLIYPKEQIKKNRKSLKKMKQ